MNTRTKILVLLVVLAIVAAAGIAHVYSTRGLRVAGAKPDVQEASDSNLAYQEPLDLGQVSLFAGSDAYDKLDAESRKIKPTVADYEVKPGLANVANLSTFKRILGPQQIGLLAKNKFVVTPTNYTQMFHIYENNEYQRPQKIGGFITTDAMLHTYHVFYDYSLRIVEVTKLNDAAIDLTNAMFAASRRDLENAQTPLVKDAARRNVAFFAVARNLLTGKAIPKDVEELAMPDLRRIMQEPSGDPTITDDESKILGVSVDFTQFIPRGHYTRSEKLKKYFRAMMWYGLTPFPITDPKAYPGAPKDLEEKTTRQALMIVRNLRIVSYKGTPAMKLWDRIYAPTAFYVGAADDLTPYDYAKVSDKVYGKSPDIQRFTDIPKLREFIRGVEGLPGPRIENYGGEDSTARTGKQFRFMGQRFIADSRILQELSYPKTSCFFPTGLDVFASMGSERALQILQTAPQYVSKNKALKKLPDYQDQLAKMRMEIKGTSPKTWQSNLYYGWLWSLGSLVKPAPQGYPSFMRSSVWTDKCLLAGLGSWTELRHDTILYAKQSAASECGSDSGQEEEPKTPKGYVEPNLEFWTKLKWLNQYTRAGLSSRGLLNSELTSKFTTLGDWIDFCRKITIKELTGQKVTEDEYKQMEMFGPDLEEITLSFTGGGDNSEVFSETDNDMAIVADVHTYDGGCLEEGTGRAGAIYVVVPIEGKLYLTRGAVYTQYEFVQPSSDRLTDEQWQGMLGSPTFKPMADWTKSFFSNMKKPEMQFDQAAGGGC
jgi:hypothetical protein